MIAFHCKAICIKNAVVVQKHCKVFRKCWPSLFEQRMLYLAAHGYMKF